MRRLVRLLFGERLRSPLWLGSLLIFFGLAFALGGGIAVALRFGATGWPTVTATVVRAARSPMLDRRGRETGGTTLEITYRYEVEGRSHERFERIHAGVTRIGVGEWSFRIGEGRVPDLEPGDSCVVHCEPRSPGVAFLDPRTSPFAYVIAAVGAAGIAGGAIVIRRRRRPRHPARSALTGSTRAARDAG